MRTHPSVTAGAHLGDVITTVGYGARSVQAWLPDATGAGEAFACVSDKTQDLRGKVRRREVVDHADFFEGDKRAEVDRNRRG